MILANFVGQLQDRFVEIGRSNRFITNSRKSKIVPNMGKYSNQIYRVFGRKKAILEEKIDQVRGEITELKLVI